VFVKITDIPKKATSMRESLNDRFAGDFYVDANKLLLKPRWFDNIETDGEIESWIKIIFYSVHFVANANPMPKN
jgi:hypothetical protein